MIVLHALWRPADEDADAGLFVWGEDTSALDEAEPAPSRPGALPFAVSPREVRSRLRRVADGILYECAEESTETLWWPTAAAGPLSSAEAGPGASVELRSWRVEGLRVPPGDTLVFLNGLGSSGPDGVRYGGSVRFWVEASAFGLGLAARQRIAPTAVADGEGPGRKYRALWRPVLSEAEDRAAMEILIRSMPGICRTRKEPPTPVGTSRNDPGFLVRDFLGGALDETVRRVLAEEGFFDAPARRGATRSVAGPLGAWLRALGWIDGRLEGEPATIEAFTREIRRWSEALAEPPPGSYRTAFRLTEPAEPGASWDLEILLQDRQDPAILVPARRVWEEQGADLAWEGRVFQKPQDRLLEDLGRASRVFPPLERALESPLPTRCSLALEEAYAFLGQGAPLLDESGFGVLVPEWWTAQENRPRLLLRLRPGEEAQASPDSDLGLVRYDWQVALGDATLDPAEFRTLVQEKAPLVRLREQWFVLDPAQREKLEALLREPPESRRLTLLDAVRLGSGAADPHLGLEASDVRAEGWLEDLLARLRGESAPEPVRVDGEFRGTLRPYQERGVGWLDFMRRVRLGACLADDMGLGKTVQLIAMLIHERRARPASAGGDVAAATVSAAADRSATDSATTDGATPDSAATDGAATDSATRDRTSTNGAATEAAAPKIGPTLVLCPMSVVGNWQREIERFAPGLRVLVHHGLRRLRDESFPSLAAEHDVVVTTYALAHRDRLQLRRVPWERIVLDEAQNIKNPSTLQARAVRSLPAISRVALTGTPLENRLSELWAILDTLNPGYLGTRAEFHRSFAVPIERYRDPRRRRALRKMVQPFLLRRLKTDPEVVRDLPEKLEMRVFCNLTREQAGLYQAVVTEMLTAIERSEGIARRGLILAALTRLKQICNHPSHYLRDGGPVEARSGKVERLSEMLEEVVAVGDRALIFTQFTEMGLILQAHLAERFRADVPFLHGGTAKAARDRMVDTFQRDRGPAVFLLSLRAGGTGLNLTAANHVFHFDRWWNPAVEDQATDRAFRIGQTRTVQVHKLVCIGTLEERIDRMILEKRELASLVVGAGEQWLTELDVSQLRELFALSHDAVSEDWS